MLSERLVEITAGIGPSCGNWLKFKVKGNFRPFPDIHVILPSDQLYQ
jgi:hypothetical protein